MLWFELHVFFIYFIVFLQIIAFFSRNHDILTNKSVSSRISKNMHIRSICPNHHPYRKCSEYACVPIFVKKRKFFSTCRDFSKNPMFCRKAMKYMKTICNSKHITSLHRIVGNTYFGPLREIITLHSTSNFPERANTLISKNPM